MDLDAGLTGAMATLVGATVFSIGFFTTRVHEALHRATDRAMQIDDRLLDAAGGSAAFNVRWLEEQQQPLRQAVDEQFPELVERLTWVFAALVVALAVIAGLDAGVESWPNAATLVAFVAAELLIVAVGMLDRRRVATTLMRRMDETLLRRMDKAVEAVKNADRATHPETKRAVIKEAESASGELVTATGGLWPDAVWLAALADLVRDYDLGTGRWTGTDQDLADLVKTFDGLTQASPQRYDWWLTYARLAELEEDWGAAGKAWLASKPDRIRLRKPDEPFRMDPPKAPETFEQALEHLRRTSRLHGEDAEETFRALARALVDADSTTAELPPVLGLWMERLVEAKLAEMAIGFIPAESWLGSPGPYGLEWPALRVEAQRLKDELVVPAERAFHAQFNRPSPQ